MNVQPVDRAPGPAGIDELDGRIIRTLADDPDLAVTYSVDPPGLSNDSVRLPQVSRRMTRPS